MKNAVEIELIRTDGQLATLAPEWRRLYERSALRNPFLSYEWNAACRRNLCPDAGLFVIAARRGDDLVGVAPLRLERQAGFRVLRFLGDGRSDYQGFLTSPELPRAEQALLDALAWLRTSWDLALLRQLADGWTGLHRSKAPPMLRARGIQADVSPYLALPGDWKTLLSEGPASVRRGQRAAKKLEKEGGSVACLRGAEAVAALEEAARVEDASWKATRGIRRFAPGAPRELMREALSGLAPRGEMEIWLARIEERPAAFLLNFLTPEQVWYYQGAYDETHRKLYPGMVLHYRCIERAFQEGRRIYDFLSGPEPYKLNWTTEARPLRYRALFPNTARGHAAFSLLVAPRWGLRQSARARAFRQGWVNVRREPAALFRHFRRRPAAAEPSGSV